MHAPARLLCAVSLTLSMLAPCAALAEPAMIYLVRHGEKESGGKYPALSAQGQARLTAGVGNRRAPYKSA